MRAPIRLGAGFARNCSESEQFDERDNDGAEIWIFDCLIYDCENCVARTGRAERRDQEEIAKPRLWEEPEC
ncbi:hypothetical protein [uncultured Bradyrhizobium sp.]|uniref:hypothetical protein n=1 Tax=Bradyrhizobium sp. TaxID=376 RepID=UPI002616984E|nr:hypothetical protein [uncultured Bradyrhizobium sp.]